MRTIEVRITGMFVRKDDKNAGVQGEGNATQLHITFDATWDGYGKRLIWRNAQGQDPVSLVLAQPEEDTQQRAYTTPIPAEALKLPGWCSFTVEGYRSGAEGEADSAALTVRDYLQVMENDSYYSPAQPTPTEAQQILGALGQAVERVDASAQEAKSWAVGGTGKREGEDTDNAGYYAQEAAQSASDALASQEAAGDSEAAAAQSAQAAGESAAQAQSAQREAQAAQGAAESARDAAMEAQQGAQSALSAAQAAQAGAERAQSAAQKAEQGAEESATSAQESAQSAQESAAAAQTASAQAQAAQTAAQTASAQAQSAQLVVEEAREDTLAALSAAQAAQEGAEQARDQAQEIVGGDFATRSEAQGYVDSHDASDLSHPDIRQALSDHADSRSNPHGVTAAQAGAISASEKGAAGGVASLGADGKVEAEQLPQMDYDPSGSAAAVQTALTSHTSNKANPHGVTAAQVGAVPTSRTVNGKALSANINLTAANVGADPAGTASSAVSAHNQDGSAHPALQAKLEGMKTAVTATYPVAAGQTIQAGDVVDVADGKIVDKMTFTVDSRVENQFSAVETADLKRVGSVNVYATNSSDYNYSVGILTDAGEKVTSVSFTASGTGQVVVVPLSDTSFVMVNNGAKGIKVGPIYSITNQGKGLSAVPNSTRDIYSGTGVDYIDAVALDSERIAIFCDYTTALNCLVCTFSSDQTYFELAGNSSISGSNAGYIRAVKLPDTGSTKRVFACYKDAANGDAGTAVIASIDSANKITWGATAIYYAEPGGVASGNSCCLSGDDVLVSFNHYSGVRYQDVCLVKVNGSVLSPQTPISLGHGSNNTTQTVALSDSVYAVFLCSRDTQPSICGLVIPFVREGDALYAKYHEVVFPTAIDSPTMVAVSDLSVLTFYSSVQNNNYGVSTALSLASDANTAIALQSGTPGQSIDIIYSGITDATFIAGGERIESAGVCGVGVLDGVLQVWSKDRPNAIKIETITYKGTGTSGSSNPCSVTFSEAPDLFMWVKSDYNGSRAETYAGMFLWAADDGGHVIRSGAEGTTSLAFSYKDSTLFWYRSANPTDDRQLNKASYSYTILGIKVGT